MNEKRTNTTKEKSRKKIAEYYDINLDEVEKDASEAFKNIQSTKENDLNSIFRYVMVMRTLSDLDQEIDIKVYKIGSDDYMIVDKDPLTVDIIGSNGDNLVDNINKVVVKKFDLRDEVNHVNVIQSDNIRLPDDFNWDKLYDNVKECVEKYN